MTDEAEGLILQILKELQATQAEIHKSLAEHVARFEQIDGRLDAVQETLYTSLGIAGSASVEADLAHRELVDLRERVRRLEEKV